MRAIRGLRRGAAADWRRPAGGLSFRRTAFPAHLLSLDQAWLDVVAVSAARFGPSPKLTVNGMPGSPLISTTGAGIGVVSTNNIVACLVNGLPCWLLREVRW
jgi:hypothetical protein